MTLASKIYEDVFLESVTYTDPGHKAVTKELAKVYARIDISDDDVIVDILVGSAQDEFRKHTRSPLYKGTVVAKFSASSGNVRFQLPLKPVVSVTKVEHNGSEIKYDREGNWILIDDFDSTQGELIEVTYQAGLLAKDDTVPTDIKEGILKYIASNYNDREDYSADAVHGMPNGSKEKWNSYRYLRF